MISYYTSTPNQPPVTDSQKASALSGLKSVPMYGYGQNFADNYGKQAGSLAADYDIAASKANADYTLKSNASEQQAVLAGLQMMADERKRQQDLANQKIGTVGSVASLLGGLYR